MRRIPALLITAGLVAAPASIAAAKPDPSPADSAWTDVFEQVASKGRLGVTVMTLSPELRAHFGSTDSTGVLVSRVQPGSPAALAGIAVGDVIVDVRGTKVDDAFDVRQALSEVGKDQKVKVKILRDHKPATLDVDLASSKSSLLDELPPMQWFRKWFEPSQPPKCT